MTRLLLDFLRRRWWHVLFVAWAGFMLGINIDHQRMFIYIFWIIIPNGIMKEASTGHRRALQVLPMNRRTLGWTFWAVFTVGYTACFVVPMWLGWALHPAHQGFFFSSSRFSLSALLVLLGSVAGCHLVSQQEPVMAATKGRKSIGDVLYLACSIVLTAFLVLLVFVVMDGRHPVSPFISLGLPVVVLGLSMFQAGKGIPVMPSMSPWAQRRAQKHGTAPAYRAGGACRTWLGEYRFGVYVAAGVTALTAIAWLMQYFDLFNGFTWRMIMGMLVPGLFIVTAARTPVWCSSLGALKTLPRSRYWLTAYLVSLLFVPLPYITLITYAVTTLVSSSPVNLGLIMLLPLALSGLALATAVSFLLWGPQGLGVGMAGMMLMFILLFGTFSAQVGRGAYLPSAAFLSLLTLILLAAVHLVLCRDGSAYRRKQPGAV